MQPRVRTSNNMLAIIKMGKTSLRICNLWHLVRKDLKFGFGFQILLLVCFPLWLLGFDVFSNSLIGPWNNWAGKLMNNMFI